MNNVHMNIVELLLSKGANPDETNDNGCWSPILVAFRNCGDVPRADFIKLLLSKGADIPNIAYVFGVVYPSYKYILCDLFQQVAYFYGNHSAPRAFSLLPSGCKYCNRSLPIHRGT